MSGPAQDAPGGRGDIIIISAPSGSGKTTLAYKLVEEMEGVRFSRSTTTRSPRPDEKDGVDYDFVSADTFDRMVEEGKFLEWALVHTDRYGTPAAFIDEMVEAGTDVVLNIDIQGALAVRAARPEAVLIFVLAPTFEELRRRLTGRAGRESGEVRRRLERGLEEVSAVGHFDYVIINDVVDDAVQRLRAVILSLRSRRERMTGTVEPILEALRKVHDTGGETP
jgi:guanylate kinase